MTFAGCDSVLCRCNTGENEVTVDIQSTANRINDFELGTHKNAVQRALCPLTSTYSVVYLFPQTYFNT